MLNRHQVVGRHDFGLPSNGAGLGVKRLAVELGEVPGGVQQDSLKLGDSVGGLHAACVDS